MSKHDKKRNRHDSSEDENEKHKRKAEKKASKVAKMLGYTNDTNPFGDSNLLQPFVWGKKVEKDKKVGKEHDADRLDLLNEIARVRKRREDREKEIEEMERLRTEEQRLREAALYGDWQRKEEEFHIDQIRVRSIIRIAERREETIDQIGKNILLLESVENETKKVTILHGSKSEQTKLNLQSHHIEHRSPVDIIEKLSASKIDELLPYITAYIQLYEKEVQMEYKQYWETIHKLVSSCQRKYRMKANGTIIHRSIATDIDRLIKNKSLDELQKLQHDIDKNIHENKVNDRSYWEEILLEINIERARIYILKIHQEIEKKLIQLKKDMKKDGDKEDDSDRDMEYKGDNSSSSSSHHYYYPPNDDSTIEAYNNTNTTATNSNKDDISTEMRIKEFKEHMNNDEEKMANNDEISLIQKQYHWSDKYRPRKPRYFNRVKTGFDWNKYNQTHYDHDNPPPKTIQGYKFAIFYPDLIDKTVTPQYVLEAADSSEFAIIRFHAGPPYEDIAFRIINKQWDTDRRSGFRCTFERGMLQLQFNFKRQFYRR